MTITVQQTPNPNARKFVLSNVRFPEPLNFSADRPVDHPLAARLLAVEGVYNVFLARDFVTVNKIPRAEWPMLEAAVEEVLGDFLRQISSASEAAQSDAPTRK